MTQDTRQISHGLQIPAKTYADQPYVVRTDDAAWLCVLTTGVGREGQSGQHVITTRSTDQGKTWSTPVAVEPSDGPEASYAVLLKAPSGRIFCFYNHNTDNLREVRADDPPYPGGVCPRVDSLGYFVFKYSDDHGQSWSARRFVIPVREMAIDRENAYGGQVRFFWNVGRPFIHSGAAFIPLHKVGGFGHGFFTRSEGVLVKSENLLTESDPEKCSWETLPNGEAGLRTPPGGGPIAEEHSFSVLSDGSFFSVYRTIDGHPACAYSRDGGHTWTTPDYLRYADGSLVKHPRAANFCWRCSNGKYLYWYHNHGGNWYDDRNPVWLLGGTEVDSPTGRVIQWSQPEVVLYDDDPYVRMSYPDLIEESGRYFLTETQKNVARVHEVPLNLLDLLWQQPERSVVTTDGLIVDLSAASGLIAAEVPMPNLPAWSERDASRPDYGTKDLRVGFTVDLWLRLHSKAPGQIVLDNRMHNSQGFCVQTGERGTLEIILNDGRTENRWTSDLGLLNADGQHHVAIIIDGGPKIICFVVDGRLCDGGEARQFGWGRFSPHLRGVNGAKTLRVGPGLNADLTGVRIYDRALRISEAIGNYRAGVAKTAGV